MTNQQIEERLRVILKEHNPCGVHVENGIPKCRGGTPCCSGCKFLSQSGCAKPNMACKFYFCTFAWKFLSESIREELKKLGRLYSGKLFMRGYISKPLKIKAPFVW